MNHLVTKLYRLNSTFSVLHQITHESCCAIKKVLFLTNPACLACFTWIVCKMGDTAAVLLRTTPRNSCKYICSSQISSTDSKRHWCLCCLLTFDTAGCSTCVNNVIAERTCVNKWKYVTWMTNGKRERCEIIYTQLTIYTGRLAGFSLQSGVLDLDTVNHGDGPPGA